MANRRNAAIIDKARKAARAMWEEGAKFAQRDPKMELRAFDAGWDAAMDSIRRVMCQPAQSNQ